MIQHLYNSKGYRLLLKQTGLKVSGVKKFFNKDIPKNTLTVDIVEIENKFDKGKTRIISYRGSDNKLLKRIITENSDGIETKTTSSYKNTCFHGELLEILREKEIAGKIIQNINEKWSVIRGKRNIIDLIKLTQTKQPDGTTSEHQIFEEFIHRNSGKIYLETFALRDTKGNLSQKTIFSNVGDIERLEKDPYLFIRNYDNKDFIKKIFEYSKKKQHLENQKIRLKFINIPEIKGAAFSNYILINPKLNQNKPEIVNTINHELRHQYQILIRKKLGFLNFLFGKIPQNTNLSGKEVNLARKYYIAQMSYSPLGVSNTEYYDNFLEIDARKYGEKALRKYTEHTVYLSRLFPNAIKKLFN